MEEDDLQKAILVFYNGVLPQSVRQAASQYLDGLHYSDNGWKIFAQKLFQTNSLEVAFYCLNVVRETILHRYLSLTNQDRSELKQALLAYMQQYIRQETPPEIRNKVAVLVVMVFRLEFPETWPEFFTDLANALLTPVQRGAVNDLHPELVSMFLLVCLTIDQEIVSNEVARSAQEHAHNTQIKDHMRNTAIPTLVDIWYQLMLKYHDNNADVTKVCAHSLKQYISWIDIRLVASDRMMNILSRLLQVDNYLTDVADVYYEIAAKGMDPASKFQLLQLMNIQNVLQRLSTTNDPEVMLKAARLVDTVGAELFSITETVNDNTGAAQQMLDFVLMEMFRYMSNEDDDTSKNACHLAGLYVHKLKTMKKQPGFQNFPDAQLERVGALLNILRAKMKYDESYDFLQPEDEEAEFQKFRKDLATLFKNITQLVPQMVAQWVTGLLQQIDSMNDPLDKEVVVNLLYLMGEGMADTLSAGEFWYEAIKHLSNSSIFMYQQPAELITCYFEVVTRYARFLQDKHDLLPQLLSLWLQDASGIMHPNIAVRSKRCDCFARFVRVLKQPLQPYLLDVVNRLKQVVQFSMPVVHFVSPTDIKCVDSATGLLVGEQLDILESIAMLVGTAPENGKHIEYLNAFIAPMVQQIQFIVEKDLVKQDTLENPVYTKWISILIQAVGTFSKGFPSNLTSNAPQDVVQFFAGALEIVLSALASMPLNTDVRKATVFYLHRMVVCLGPSVMIPMVPRLMEILLFNANAIQTIDFISLINQFASYYKAAMAETMNQQFLPIVNKIMQLVMQGEAVTAQSEEERERTDLKRAYFSFIWTVSSSDLIGVLVSDTNMSSFDNVIQTIMQGCVAYADLNVVKTSFQILKLMVDSFMGQNPLPGFVDFVYGQVVKAVFEVALAPAFSLNDARTSEVLFEMVSVLKAIHGARGEEFEAFLQNMFLPQLNFPADFANSFVAFLRTATPKLLSKEFRLYMKRRKES